MKSEEPLQTCALRALTLCDGQVLEEPQGALTRCLCAALRAAEDDDDELLATVLRNDRQRLLEDTLAPWPASAPS